MPPYAKEIYLFKSQKAKFKAKYFDFATTKTLCPGT